MGVFKLNKQLQKDSHLIGRLDKSYILLMKNSLVPWIVIVPEVNETEFYEIENREQQKLLQQINIMSRFLSADFKTDKINVATIGNVVKQMHIHIVGRFENDYCWPGVVWGAKEMTAYADNEVERIKILMGEKIEGLAIC